MNIKRVKYKMSKDDTWKVGYIIGAYEGQSKTLLDCNFEYVPKMQIDNKDHILYDMRIDGDKYLNITIPL